MRWMMHIVKDQTTLPFLMRKMHIAYGKFKTIAQIGTM